MTPNFVRLPKKGNRLHIKFATPYQQVLQEIFGPLGPLLPEVKWFADTTIEEVSTIVGPCIGGIKTRIIDLYRTDNLAQPCLGIQYPKAQYVANQVSCTHTKVNVNTELLEAAQFLPAANRSS